MSDGRGGYLSQGASQGSNASRALENAQFYTVKPTEIRILSILGHGAQGTVYKALWTRTFSVATSERLVAVKQLTSNLSEVYRNRERLTMLTEDHPHVVKCFDSTLEHPYLLVTELCEGGALFDLLYGNEMSRVRLTCRQQLKILTDVASGMRYLHAQVPQILHRDLKSSNVLLAKAVRSRSQEPFAKVADFGLARAAVTSPASMNGMTVQVGTYRWMAPEVFEDSEGLPYNAKVDVYSFGILMYEVIEQRLPYDDLYPLSEPDPRIGLYVCSGRRPTFSPHGPPGLCRREDASPEILQDLRNLMELAWHMDPQIRPDFQELEEILRSKYQEA
eukprot:TRINITY_DN50189_c0_g1_i1.p1 TRINITY_DN50189_c0_g1~~TRINITY_DN50189_c0_g1_i1.p1  ORF type:complete len:333 (+),score=57.75 TRINITY_DN50189_c0_g1_i1:74-1072(+)